MSAACSCDALIRVVAIFPRRPKIKLPGQKSFLIKINRILFEWSRQLSTFGIPSFAVAPHSSSLFNCEDLPSLHWFSIGVPPHSMELSLEINLESITPGVQAPLTGPLSDSDVLNIVRTTTEPHAWIEYLEFLSLARHKVAPDYFSRFGGPAFYRPVFYLLWDDDDTDRSAVPSEIHSVVHGVLLPPLGRSLVPPA